MNELDRLEQKANKAAERWGRALVAEERTREEYSKAHAEVLAYLKYLTDLKALKAAPLTADELRAREAFE